MFDCEYTPTPKAKKPTFFQFIKDCHKGIEGKTKFSVESFYIPGKFENYTLSTNAFRYIITPDNPLFDAFANYYSNLDFECEHRNLQITIVSIQDKAIKFSEGKTKGKWERLGTTLVVFKAT